MTQNNRRWTLMVYMAGDNGKIFEQLDRPLMYGMESQGWADIQKMARVGSTKDVAVVVQFDTFKNDLQSEELQVLLANTVLQYYRFIFVTFFTAIFKCLKDI